MSEPVSSISCGWLHNGQEAFAAMIEAIASAHTSIRLEMYIYRPSPIGDRLRQALINASQRGVAVSVLLDALGSMEMPNDYWKTLTLSGGRFRWFNPLHLNRLGLRDHRKLLVCDETIAFIGGFNVAPEYDGDGIHRGWRDLGLRLEGSLVCSLVQAFDEMFAQAEFKHKPFPQLRSNQRHRTVSTTEGQLLLSAPGRVHNPLKQALREDLKKAKSVQIISAYFLPTWRLRRDLMAVVRRGGRVQLILAGQSDVRVSQLASRSLYSRLLRAGVEIYEYQPQVLHAKMFVIDEVVYAGSANLDSRSLHTNYELLVRLPNAERAAQGRAIFTSDLVHCHRITLAAWRRTRTFWARVQQHFAYLILARVDPFLTRLQLRILKRDESRAGRIPRHQPFE